MADKIEIEKLWEKGNPTLHQENEDWNKTVDENGSGNEGKGGWGKDKMQQRHQPFLKARGESDRSPWH